MKHLQTLLLCLLFPLALSASVWDTQYKQIEKNIRTPVFADRTFDITKYGASLTNTAAKNQKAINKAIEECSKAGGGRVVIPAGTWKTGAIRLKSHVNLVIEKDATLFFEFDRDLYPLVETRWEGLDCINYSPLIYAFQETDIAITGEGTIDGNGSDETWWLMSGKTPKSRDIVVEEKQQNPGGRADLLKMAEDGVPVEKRVFGPKKGLRPQMVNFNQCDGILIEGLTMVRSPFWVMHPLLSKNITVRNVTVHNDGPNGDGCDPESCENVLIENCIFDTGDDCIAIKSGRNEDGREGGKGRYVGRPSKNIIVRNCVMKDGHGGVVIGSEISGGCNNVFVENCKMDSPNLDRILRIKTNSARGGVIENIYMRNVEVGQCAEAVLKINLDYEPKEIAKRGYYPTVRNVYMENVTCQKSKYGVMVVGFNDRTNVYNINVKNCKFDGVYGKPLYITGQTKDMNYDNLIINGSLVLTETPYKNYSEWLTHSEMQRVPHPYMLDFAKKPKWGYVMGIEQEAMLDTYLAYKDESIVKYLKEYCDTMIDKKGNILTYDIKDYNLDQIRTGKFVLRWNQLYPEKKNLKAIKTLFKQLEDQPRTDEGVWWHKAIYAKQVWLDGIFMGLPFYTHAVTYLNKKEQKVYDDAVMQIKRTDFRTYDQKTGLWKHAWDETHKMFWANPETGLSQHTWSRAQGWFAMALVEVLDALPKDYAQRQDIIDILKKVLKATVDYQDKETGVWYDVMDVKDREGNYLEATSSSMFAYCLLKAARLGYVGDDMRQAGIKAYKGILKEFIKVNPDKTISLTRCCEVSGLGPDNAKGRRRDGSFEYYISEPIRN
ncbi:MAG: glycoside hydrolase family 88 protein, partial [Prevotellaceae bacterium]|nr:glycoside hydrolase family 88 protein [Prevotellaceae bacterium]